MLASGPIVHKYGRLDLADRKGPSTIQAPFCGVSYVNG